MDRRELLGVLSAGAAGLVKSRGFEVASSIGGPLTSNEVKQLLTLTAEDVLWRRSKLGLHMSAAEQEAVREYLGG